MGGLSTKAAQRFPELHRWLLNTKLSPNVKPTWIWYTYWTYATRYRTTKQPIRTRMLFNDKNRGASICCHPFPGLYYEITAPKAFEIFDPFFSIWTFSQIAVCTPRRLFKQPKARRCKDNGMPSLHIQKWAITQMWKSQTHTCNLTTLSNASLCEKSVGTCWMRCCHHVGDENRWIMATEQRSNRTGGTTVGSDESENMLIEGSGR